MCRTRHWQLFSFRTLGYHSTGFRNWKVRYSFQGNFFLDVWRIFSMMCLGFCFLFIIPVLRFAGIWWTGTFHWFLKILSHLSSPFRSFNKSTFLPFTLLHCNLFYVSLCSIQIISSNLSSGSQFSFAKSHLLPKCSLRFLFWLFFSFYINPFSQPSNSLC